MLNRDKFFADIRPMFDGGKMRPVQVDVINKILDAAESIKLSSQELAYVLATGFGESKFTPVREVMNYSAARIREVWPTRPEAVRFARKPRELANSVYGGRMGNHGGNDGWDFRGGGVCQITGRGMFAKFGLENAPDKILDNATSVKVMIDGMVGGIFTGHRLSDYATKGGYDFINAREIINGDVKLNGKKYAGYAMAFLIAINSARGIVTEPRVTVFAAIVAAILRIFRKVK
jgi:putative chitinase